VEEAVEDKINDLLARIEQIRSQPCDVSGFQDLEALEQEVSALTGQLGTSILAQKVQEIVTGESFRKQEDHLIQSLPGRYLSEGYRVVRVQACGGEIRIRRRYFRRKGQGVSYRKRKGVYPGLRLLGIGHGCTPYLGSQAGALVAAVGSREEAREALARWGGQTGY